MIRPPAGASRKVIKGKTARQRLMELEFDPLDELVETYKALKTEAEIQTAIRDNALVLLRHDGKPRAYNSAQHMQALSEKAKVAGTLTEYMYKKAAQEQVDERPAIPFQIILNRDVS